MQKNDSDKKVTTAFFLLLICLVTLSGCAPFEVRANVRLSKLRSMSSTLPIVPGSELLVKHEDIVRSHEPSCATVHIWQVFGTNNQDLSEIVHWYKTSLNSTMWQFRDADSRSASFVSAEGVNFSVSDNYRWFPTLAEVVKQGQTKYKTLFLVSLSAFVDPNMTTAKCT